MSWDELRPNVYGDYVVPVQVGSVLWEELAGDGLALADGGKLFAAEDAVTGRIVIAREEAAVAAGR